MGWKKKGPGKKSGYPIRWHGSDFIYTKNSARPGSGFYLHKLFRGLFGKKLLRKMTDTVYIEKFSALRAPIFKDNIDFYKKKPYTLKTFSRCAGLKVKKFYKKKAYTLKSITYLFALSNFL